MKVVFVHLKSDPKVTGNMIKVETQPLPTAEGSIKYITICHVLWDNEEMRSPCPSAHAPDELEWDSIPEIDNIFDEEDEEEEEDDEEETSEDAEDEALIDAAEEEVQGTA